MPPSGSSVSSVKIVTEFQRSSWYPLWQVSATRHRTLGRLSTLQGTDIASSPFASVQSRPLIRRVCWSADWQVHITDSAGHQFNPQDFDRLFLNDQAKT